MEVSLVPGTVYFGEGQNNGEHKLDSRLNGYAAAARHQPWFITRDLDHDDECALRLRERLLANIPDNLCFRIAVRQIESWLIADRSRLAEHLGVSIGRLPINPELEHDPKQIIIEAARRSRRRAVRETVPPREGSGRKVGLGYRDILETFVADVWEPRDAMANSISLSSTIRRLEALSDRLEV